MAIIDVTLTADTGFAIADALLALPAPPTVMPTSSTDRNHFGTQLNGHHFIAKADICTAAITRLATAPEAGQPESPSPAARHPAQAMSLVASAQMSNLRTGLAIAAR